MIVVTGASGALGRLVIQGLLKKLPAAQIVAAVRDPSKVEDLAAQGVQVRRADYDDAASLDAAFAGAQRVLMVSGHPGHRLEQHRNVVEAARRAKVGLLAYTSILHGDASPLRMREDHVATENMIRASGLRFAFLRNGWYLENFRSAIMSAAQHGQAAGAAGEGRISAAARADYADAAAAVLTLDDPQPVYELAGSTSFSMPELVAEVARQTGRPALYKHVTQEEYAAMLAGFGIPAPMPELLADSDAQTAQGGLYDEGKVLEGLIGRPTRSMAEAVRQMLAA